MSRFSLTVTHDVDHNRIPVRRNTRRILENQVSQDLKKALQSVLASCVLTCDVNGKYSNSSPKQYESLVQGDRKQTVKSNFDLTERKHAMNFNLKVDSDQGRLGI